MMVLYVFFVANIQIVAHNLRDPGYLGAVFFKSSWILNYVHNPGQGWRRDTHMAMTMISNSASHCVLCPISLSILNLITL